MLVGNKKNHSIQLPPSSGGCNIGSLLAWIRDNLLQERSELFLANPEAKSLDVRPGILVLVNDSDWELLGQTEYELEVSISLLFQFYFDVEINFLVFFRTETRSPSCPPCMGARLPTRVVKDYAIF